MDRLTISIDPVHDEHGESWSEIRSSVNGREFGEMVRTYEERHRVDPPGGYRPMPHAGMARARDRLLGRDRSRWPGNGRTVLLVGDCRDEGCWPLFARVRRVGAVFRWDGFEQPHRPERDYSGLGPFVFDAAAYTSEVDRLLPVQRAG